MYYSLEFVGVKPTTVLGVRFWSLLFNHLGNEEIDKRYNSINGD